MSRPVYAYDRERGDDPHAVVIEISDEDAQAWYTVREREDGRLPRYEFGSYVPVTDLTSGDRYRLATAPCGLGCRCAAVAVKEETT